jgi:hypothetical protein
MDVVNINSEGATAAYKWIIERNINQTGWASVPLLNSQIISSSDFSSKVGVVNNSLGTDVQFIKTAPTIDNINSVIGLGGSKSMVTWVSDTGTADQKHIAWQENLEKYLPQNVTILKAEIGIRSWDSSVKTDHQKTMMLLALNKYAQSNITTNLDYFSSLPTVSPPNAAGIKDANVVNDSELAFAVIDGYQINGIHTTILATIDTTNLGGFDLSSSYVTGKNYAMSMTLDLRYLKDGDAPAAVNCYLSPIMIKYRW